MSAPASSDLIATALFVSEGDQVIPTELSRGPWDPRHCHGGPVCAILARAVETCPDDSDTDWQVARLSVDIERPVPVCEPLSVAVAIERPGRTVSLVGAELRHGDRLVARVRALRIRRVAIPVPTGSALDTPVVGLESPGQGRRERVTGLMGDLVAYHSHACEHRFTRGGWLEPGPCAMWTRLTVAVVDGEEPTGLQRLAAAADFGSGVSAVLPLDRYTFINADISIHLVRPSTGPWIGLSSRSWFGEDGAGLAETELVDSIGRVGRSVQSLVVDRRRSP